jgi:sigma-E factor negative regulatory protein RseB
VVGKTAAWLCGISLLLAPAAWAELSPRDYLDQMSHGFRELDYRGEFTYEFGSHMDTLSIAHAVRDGVEKERLVYLNGKLREVVRDGHPLNCIHPGDEIMRLGSVITSGPLGQTLQGNHDIADYYGLAYGESTRIAGRAARQIVVQPADEYRYGFHLYLDQQTGLLLKSVTFSPVGTVLERFQFTRIEIGAAITDSELSATQADSHHANHYMVAQAGTAGAPVVDSIEALWLPPGFYLSATAVQQAGDRPVQLSMYTDGFATLTLVLEANHQGIVTADDGKAHRGATVAYMRQLSRLGQPYLLTVVGEVPLLTAEKVARNAVFKEG